MEHEQYSFPEERDRLLTFLESISLLQFLPRERIELLLDRCTKLTLEEGDILCRKGELSDTMYLLVFGKLGVKMEDSAPVAFIDPVSTIGEMGVFTGMPRSATVQAFQRSGLLSLKGEDIHSLISEDHEFAIAILSRVISILSERIAADNIRINEIQNYLVNQETGGPRLPRNHT